MNIILMLSIQKLFQMVGIFLNVHKAEIFSTL